MKKSEIKVGTEYVEARDANYRASTYPSVTRVKVTGSAYSEKRSHYPYTVKSFVPVVFIETGEKGAVETRLIREPWADWEAHYKDLMERRNAGALVRRAELKARLRRLAPLVKALEEIEVPLETSTIYNENTALSLANFGALVMFRGFENGTGYYEFVAPLASSLEDFVFHNKPIKIDAALLETLLRIKS